MKTIRDFELENKKVIIRCDFNVPNKDGKIIFGELTFTPACCCAPYYTKEANEKLGKMI